MHLSSIDINNTELLNRVIELENISNAATRQGWQGLPLQARMTQWRAADGWSKTIIGAWADNSLLGCAAIMSDEDAPETTWIFCWQDPNHAAIATAQLLLEACESASSPVTTRFVSSIFRSTAAEANDYVCQVFAPLGYVIASRETVLELELDDRILSSEPQKHAYSISTYADGVPKEFRQEVGIIKGLVDAQAPNGELNWEASVISIEEYEAEIARWREQNQHCIESIAVDEAGEVAGWTCLVVSQDPSTKAHVEGTLVLESHRGHGLGHELKLQNMGRLQELFPGRIVRTSSEDANSWMHRINRSLGFAPVEVEYLIHKKLH